MVIYEGTALPWSSRPAHTPSQNRRRGSTIANNCKINAYKACLMLILNHRMSFCDYQVFFPTAQKLSLARGSMDIHSDRLMQFWESVSKNWTSSVKLELNVGEIVAYAPWRQKGACVDHRPFASHCILLVPSILYPESHW